MNDDLAVYRVEYSYTGEDGRYRYNASLPVITSSVERACEIVKEHQSTARIHAVHKNSSGPILFDKKRLTRILEEDE